MSSPAWTIPDETAIRCEALCGAGTYDPQADGWRDGYCPDDIDDREEELCP